MLPSLPANGAGSISPPPPPPPPSHPSPTTTDATQPPSSDTNPPAPQRPLLRCPRCDSTNTKFCYFNNYSLTQPRHFCKSCRRYWTHGGALRNVPIGGGSRKSKKSRSSRLSPLPGDIIDGALKLFQGGIGIGITSSPAPVVDFQLGNLSNNSFPLYHPNPNPNPNHLSPFGDLINLNLPGSNFNNNNDQGLLLASSIESLSSFNQELHWKLQQQRSMAVLYHSGAGGGGENESVTTAAFNLEKKPQSIFFQNLEVTNPPTQAAEIGMHQWFFDATYGGVGGSGNDNCGDGVIKNDIVNGGGYVVDKDGVIKFQQCPQWLGMKKM